MIENEDNVLINAYGNKLRLRVCGVCFKGDQILLVKHRNLGEKGYFQVLYFQ